MKKIEIDILSSSNNGTKKNQQHNYSPCVPNNFRIKDNNSKISQLINLYIT